MTWHGSKKKLLLQYYGNSIHSRSSVSSSSSPPPPPPANSTFFSIFPIFLHFEPKYCAKCTRELRYTHWICSLGWSVFVKQLWTMADAITKQHHHQRHFCWYASQRWRTENKNVSHLALCKWMKIAGDNGQCHLRFGDSILLTAAACANCLYCHYFQLLLLLGSIYFTFGFLCQAHFVVFVLVWSSCSLFQCLLVRLDPYSMCRAAVSFSAHGASVDPEQYSGQRMVFLPVTDIEQISCGFVFAHRDTVRIALW